MRGIPDESNPRRNKITGITHLKWESLPLAHYFTAA
ncbi:Uncharacterised protein [Vibrio cholerae]|nr:Uncharacterised protein [Vibrio cholerae]CSB79133.1 Uncharacterised protein [Vibrio cholerae]